MRLKNEPGEWTEPSAIKLSDGTCSLPAHKGGGGLPAGGNELYADGSVSWVKATDMYNFYSGTSTRNFYFYQQDLGNFPMAQANPPKFPN